MAPCPDVHFAQFCRGQADADEADVYEPGDDVAKAMVVDAADAQEGRIGRIWPMVLLPRPPSKTIGTELEAYGDGVASSPTIKNKWHGA